MKTRAWVACLACVALGFFLGNLAQPQLIGQEKAKEPSLAKREYKVITELDSKSLNELGEQGWDLVTVVLWGPEGRHFYLRRSKP